jgi:lipoprotein-anchoring transpeptidase ErfK/SrfK
MALAIGLTIAGLAALGSASGALAAGDTALPADEASITASLATAAAPAPQADLADAAMPASLLARIDLSDQRMSVYVDDRLEYEFAISTARKGYLTPVGDFHPEFLSPRHRSRKYNNAPMPWAVFFHKGWAVHGTTEVTRLGRPASHGCVRLHPDNAKIFFTLVKDLGMANTTISVVQ